MYDPNVPLQISATTLVLLPSRKLVSNIALVYRKIPKISPRAYIFQRLLLRGLFLERPIFGGAYGRREICVIKSVGLACSGKEIYHFCFVLLCNRGQIPSTSPPGSLYSEGRFNRGFFGRLIFGILRYLTLKRHCSIQKQSLNNPTIHYLIKTSYKQKSASILRQI